MATFDFNIEIDIDEMISRKTKLPNMEEYVLIGIENGIKETVERLIEKLRENMILYGLGSSNLINNINVSETSTGIYIGVDTDYAMFVEYGTGIVGDANKHPKSNEFGWRYDVNNHGESGWWYPSSPDDPNPTKYLSETGWWAWTKGQRSKPFMYNTWLWGTRSINNIVNKHIRRELEKMERDFK